LYEDTENQGQFVEYFKEDSWAAHLWHHERVTNADKPLQDAVFEFHQGSRPPRAEHFLAAYQLKRKA